LNSVVLPAPFGPDDPERLAFRHRECKIVGRNDRAEAFLEAGDLQQHSAL